MDGALVTVGSLYLKEKRSLPPQVICTSTVAYLPTHLVLGFRGFMDIQYVHSNQPILNS
jgi:hypothetical protein